MSQEKIEKILKGIPTAPGVVSGTAFVFINRDLEIPVFEIPESGWEAEKERFERAIHETRRQITTIRREISAKLGEGEAQIFDAHLLVLEDKALIDETMADLPGDVVSMSDAHVTIDNQVQIDLQVVPEVSRSNFVHILHFRMLANDLFYFSTCFPGGSDIDELIHAGPNDLQCGKNDQHGNNNGPDVVEEVPPGDKDSSAHGQQSRNRADGIESVMPGVGRQGHTLQAGSESCGPAVQDLLDGQGKAGCGKCYHSRGIMRFKDM